jgi:hypothetical protein
VLAVSALGLPRLLAPVRRLVPGLLGGGRAETPERASPAVEALSMKPPTVIQPGGVGQTSVLPVMSCELCGATIAGEDEAHVRRQAETHVLLHRLQARSQAVRFAPSHPVETT